MQQHDLSLADLKTLRAGLELYHNMGQLADTNGQAPRFSLVPGQPLTITLPVLFEAAQPAVVGLDIGSAHDVTVLTEVTPAEALGAVRPGMKIWQLEDPAPIEAETDGPGNAMDETDDIARQLLTPDEYETWSMYWSMDPAHRWLVVPVTVAGLIEKRPKVEAAPEVEPAAEVEAEPAAAPQPEPPAQPEPAPEPAPEAARPPRWSEDETEVALGIIVNAVLAGRSAYSCLAEIAQKTGRPQPSIQQRIKREWKAEIAARVAQVKRQAQAQSTLQAAPAQAAPAQMGLELDALAKHLNAHAGKGGWTISEDAELFRLAEVGWKVPEIATEMGRDGKDVQRRFDLLADKKGARFPRADVAARLAGMLPPDVEA